MNNFPVGNKIRYLLFFLFLINFTGVSFAQEDHAHFSSTFGKEKKYRVYLPQNYAASLKRYPVIYYFHGNKGTHEFPFSEAAKKLVDDHEIILVAWNGRSVDSDARPYNIGFQSNINYETQFKDYFLELVEHIDTKYRTFTDRENRGIIGHSMGGIMSFFLAGKYPQMVGAAVNSKGSPEFFIGYPDNHTLYNVRYLFENLHGVKLRFVNSTVGELVHLNNEVHQGALREKDLSYVYHIYEGGHSLKAPEFTDAFNFIVDALKDPLPKPERWHHSDLYPDFHVWGYDVKSNLDEPGFLALHGVTRGGFGITTKKWMPHGRTIPGVNIEVETSGDYKPNELYNVLTFNQATNKKDVSKVKSDSEGRIQLSFNHEPHQVGIFRKNDPAEIVLLDYEVEGAGAFLNHNSESKVKLRLLNRGGSAGKGLKVNLSTSTEGVVIANQTIDMGNLPSAEDNWLSQAFKVTASNKPPQDGSPFRVRFNITITDNGKQVWKDEFDAPVYFDVPEFSQIGIDDGDSEIYGHGNGNNIAEPGESVMIYQESHRVRLYYDDPYIDSERIHVDLQPDKWGDGYAVSSVIHIAEDCPIGHEIKFLASYEVKEWKTIKRNVTWGTFTITVGKDTD